jgi:hypothetical protein
MEILVQEEEKDVMEMMEDAIIDMKKPHRNPFLKEWKALKAEKAVAEVSCSVARRHRGLVRSIAVQRRHLPR